MLWPPTDSFGGRQVDLVNFESSLSSMGNHTKMPGAPCIVDTFLIHLCGFHYQGPMEFACCSLGSINGPNFSIVIIIALVDTHFIVVILGKSTEIFLSLYIDYVLFFL